MKQDYIQAEIQKYSASLQQIPKMFKQRKRETERQIDALCEKAGILDQIEQLRESLEKQKTQLQSQADMLNGRVQQLREIEKQFFYAPIPDGVTHMYGLELEKLDPETRLLVLNGNPETIQALGGTLKEEKETVIPEFVPEPEPEVEELNWDFTAHWKTKVRKALELYETDLELFEKVYEAESDQIRAHIDRNLPDEESWEEDYSDEEPEMTPEEIREFLVEAEKRVTTPRQRERLEQMKREYGVD